MLGELALADYILGLAKRENTESEENILSEKDTLKETERNQMLLNVFSDMIHELDSANQYKTMLKNRGDAGAINYQGVSEGTLVKNRIENYENAIKWLQQEDSIQQALGRTNISLHEGGVKQLQPLLEKYNQLLITDKTSSLKK